MKKLLKKFLQDSEYFNQNRLYNEASLQHELGCFLRGKQNIPVSFEKPVGDYWKDWEKKYTNKTNNNEENGENKTIKKNIDLVLNYNSENIAIELKYPKKGDPENVEFWAFVTDIKFLEEMVYSNNCKIAKGYFIVVFDTTKKTLYDSTINTTSSYNIYNIFRKIRKLEKEITYPFKDGTEQPIKLEGVYEIDWQILENSKLGYLLIEVSM